MAHRNLNIIAGLALIAASGCTMTDNSSLQSVSDMRPTSVVQEGQFIALGQTVKAGSLEVTALRVIEDSRCPSDAQCTWEGEITLVVNVKSLRGIEEREVSLGEEIIVHGRPLTLTDVRPNRLSEDPIDPRDYRFRFSAS